MIVKELNKNVNKVAEKNYKPFSLMAFIFECMQANHLIFKRKFVFCNFFFWLSFPFVITSI